MMREEGLREDMIRGRGIDNERERRKEEGGRGR